MKKILKHIKAKPILIMLIIFYILLTLSTTCLMYSILKIQNIENILRYLVSAFLGLLLIYCLMQTYKLIIKGKLLGILLFGIVIFGLFIGESYACGLINKIYTSIDNIYKESYTYTTNLITMKDNNIKDISGVKNLKIGIISDTKSIDGYEIANEIINDKNLKNKNQIIEYATQNEIITDLYDKKIDAALVSSNYISTSINSEKFTNIASETKTIYTKSKTIMKKNDNTKKDVNEPFTMLVLGIDSTQSDMSKVTAFNADSLMLITFNPTTYNATIVSIPRDTYATISCLKNSTKSKITHSGWYGESCVIDSLEELMGINIDYYVKINFKGVVNLVNAVDGIEVDVPYSFCEQNSERLWGNNTIYVEKGLQILNGEEALALSRNRHPNVECGIKWSNYNSSDLIRGQNQQKIINALINKIAKNTTLDKVYSILNVIKNNVDTNMSTNEILSYYNLAKDIALNSVDNDNIITFEKLYLSTYGKYLYDSLMNISLSYQIYYEESLEEIINEMKINLELKKPELIKSFDFSINKEYQKKIIGKGTYNQEEIKTVPNFVGKTYDIAETWTKQIGIKLVIEYDETSEKEKNIIMSQSIPASYLLNNVDKTKALTIKVSKNESTNKKQNLDDNSKKEYPTE